MNAATESLNVRIVAGYDFSRFNRVVDVGGGRGALLEAIVHANPGVHGTLFDQPHVVAGVELDGCDVVGGSFFESVPRGGDAYVLKSVIHDWGDEESIAILRACAAALDGDACVLLVERDLGDEASAWLDLQMLVMLCGRERTEDEYAGLFRAAGLEPSGVTPVGAGLAVYEARSHSARVSR
jgi:O-methyltransferase